MASYSAAATSYLTYGNIRSPSVPFGIAVWGLMCIFFPYSWRGALSRYTFKCPSFIMAIFFLCIGVPLHFATAQVLPDATVNMTLNNPGMAKFGATIKTNASLFIGTHLLMVLLRCKWTLTKWQALLFCEIAKNMYVVLLLWGYYSFYQPDPEHQQVVGVLVWAFVAVLLTITVVRLFYAVQCRFDSNTFNHLYFGTDSNCPMQRFYLMCNVLVCEKNPNSTAFQEHVDENENVVVKNPVRESNLDRLQNLQVQKHNTSSLS